MDKTDQQTTFKELFQTTPSPRLSSCQKNDKKQADSNYISIIKKLEKHLEATNIKDTYFPNGMTTSVQRKIKKGTLEIKLSCDLHGYNRRDALVAVYQFLRNAQSQKEKYVLVIFGKGKQSQDNRPVLKPVILSMLQNSAHVVGYTTAHHKDGGSGAAYVILKNIR